MIGAREWAEADMAPVVSELRCHVPGHVLVKKQLKLLTQSAEDRAIEALQNSGVRISRLSDGRIYSLMVARDEDLVWLQHIPKLSGVSLMNFAVSDTGMENLGKCDQISTVHFRQTTVSDHGWAQLPKMDSLRSVSIHGTDVSPNGIAALKYLKGLRSLSLECDLTADHMEAIRELNGLTSLSLEPVIFREGVADALVGIKQLDRLTLNLRHVTDEQCELLAAIDAELTLSIQNSTALTNLGWESLCTPKLTRLTISSCSLSDKSMPAFANLKAVTSLFISDVHLTDASLIHLSSLNNLRYLSLRGTQITEESCRQLQEQLPTLRTINLYKSGIGLGNSIKLELPFMISAQEDTLRITLTEKPTVESVASVNKIKDIDDLSSMRFTLVDEDLAMMKEIKTKGIRIASEKVTDQGLSELSGHPTLESVSIDSPLITDQGITALLEIPNLHELSLTKSRVTDSGARALLKGMCERGKLSSLSITECESITDDVFAELAGCESLTQLEVTANPKVTSDLLEHIQLMPSLTELRLSKVTVEPQDIELLAGTKIDRIKFDAAQLEPGTIEALVRVLPNLKRLSLISSNVDDADMDAISNLSDLEWLWLTGTPVTDEGIEKLSGLHELTHLFVNQDTVSVECEQQFNERQGDNAMRRYSSPSL